MQKHIEWTPPKRIDDLYKSTDGNTFSNINRPVAGARVDKPLPRGEAPVQLYSLATPNGKKVSILFEELIEAGCNLNYDAFLINIGEGEQFTSGFVEINPNSKIPACIDYNGAKRNPISLFESGSICLYFAEKFDKFIPKDPALKAEMLNWIFWQMGSQGPMTGQFGHFFVYAPEDKAETRDYAVARYGMETQRICDLLNITLSKRKYIIGNEISLADIMIFPWFHQLLIGYPHKSGLRAKEFLNMPKYKSAIAWCESLAIRPGFDRGMQVCDWTKIEYGTKPWLNSDFCT